MHLKAETESASIPG